MILCLLFVCCYKYSDIMYINDYCSVSYFLRICQLYVVFNQFIYLYMTDSVSHSLCIRCNLDFCKIQVNSCCFSNQNVSCADGNSHLLYQRQIFKISQPSSSIILNGCLGYLFIFLLQLCLKRGSLNEQRRDDSETGGESIWRVNMRNTLGELTKTRQLTAQQEHRNSLF